ncbi:MAG: hypothetical protein WC343_02225 [Bacilli bacterium]|jgi:hypothetical protein
MKRVDDESVQLAKQYILQVIGERLFDGIPDHGILSFVECMEGMPGGACTSHSLPYLPDSLKGMLDGVVWLNQEDEICIQLKDVRGKILKPELVGLLLSLTDQLPVRDVEWVMPIDIEK